MIEELIEKTIKGNKRAESELYIIYRNKLKIFLINKYGYNDDHFDDVSEILMKILGRLKSYDPLKSKFDTWVYTIAKNYMIDKSKKVKPQHLSFTSNTTIFDGSNENYFEPTSHNSTPLEILETNDFISHISKNITTNDYSMLTMKYVDGYSHSEIAKQFNSSENKICNRINYTKNKIKKGSK